MCRAYSLRTLVRLYLCQNHRNIKTAGMMILCVATPTSLPLGAGAIYFSSPLDIAMAQRPNVLFLLSSFANLWVFTFYFNYFDLVFHILYLNRFREISTFSTLIQLYELHHTDHSLNLYKNHVNRQRKMAQQH